MQILESVIETAFAEAMKTIGVVTLKLNILGNRGWPDRLVILPEGRTVFIEFKIPGAELEPLQKFQHDTLRRLEHKVMTFDNAERATMYVVNQLR